MSPASALEQLIAPPTHVRGRRAGGGWGTPGAARTVLSPPQLPEMLALSSVQAETLLPKGEKGNRGDGTLGAGGFCAIEAEAVEVAQPLRRSQLPAAPSPLCSCCAGF